MLLLPLLVVLCDSVLVETPFPRQLFYYFKEFMFSPSLCVNVGFFERILSVHFIKLPFCMGLEL